MASPTLQNSMLDLIAELVQMHADSWRGLTEVAEGIQQEQTASMLREIGRQRLAAAEELKKILEDNGRKAPSSSSAQAALHRFWIDLKSKLTDGSPFFVLGEVERGDGFLLRKYGEVLTHTSGTGLHGVLTGQCETVRDQAEQMKQHRSRFVAK